MARTTVRIAPASDSSPLCERGGCRVRDDPRHEPVGRSGQFCDRDGPGLPEALKETCEVAYESMQWTIDSEVDGCRQRQATTVICE